MAMAVAASGGTCRLRAFFGRCSPLVAPARKRRIQFALQHRFNETADAQPDAGFKRIEPPVPEEKFRPGRTGCLLRAMAFHGVISIGAPTPNLLVSSSRRLRHRPFPTTPATAPVLLLRVSFCVAGM